MAVASVCQPKQRFSDSTFKLTSTRCNAQVKVAVGKKDYIFIVRVVSWNDFSISVDSKIIGSHAAQKLLFI